MTKNKRKLMVYAENNDFVIEQINEFNHATKRVFPTKENLLENLKIYTNALEDYEIEVSKDLWRTVINYLSRAEA